MPDASIIMLILSPKESIWKSTQEKIHGWFPSLIQGMKWFKTSRWAKKYITVLATAVTCLLAGRRKARAWKVASSSNPFLFMKVTAFYLTTSEGGHDSNHIGSWGSRLMCIHSSKARANQYCLLYWAVCFWNRLLSSSQWGCINTDMW